VPTPRQNKYLISSVLSRQNKLSIDSFAKANKLLIDSFAKANKLLIDSFAKANKTTENLSARGDWGTFSAMKIASWNVNSLNMRMAHLADWLQESKMDVVCLQETKMEDHKFPVAALEDLGYESAFIGQKSYNGVAILSRRGLAEVQTDFSDADAYGVLNASDQRRVIAATVAGVRVINVYIVNGQALESDKFEFKLRWLKALHGVLEHALLRHPKLVLLGDFNIAPSDLDVYDPDAWAGQIHCSEAERAALQRLYALGLMDSFRCLEPAQKAYSWWDYRQAAFRRDRGLRIDLALISNALLANLTAVGIDRAPRERESPSDHTPIWLELSQ
jgi:exodeoxyribonuclease III